MPRYFVVISDNNQIIFFKNSNFSRGGTYRRTFRDPMGVFLDYLDLVSRWYASKIKHTRQELDNPFNDDSVVARWKCYESTKSEYDMSQSIGMIGSHIISKWLSKNPRTPECIEEVLSLIEYLQPFTLIKQDRFDELEKRINEYLLKERI